MRQLIAQENRLDDFLLASRGLAAAGGAKAGRAALGAAARQGIDLSGFRAKPATPADFRNFELLLAMDTDSRNRLLDMAPAGYENRVHCLLDFAPWIGTDDVPDPTFGGEDAADDVFELLLLALRGLIEVIDQSSADLTLPVQALAPVNLKASSSR